MARKTPPVGELDLERRPAYRFAMLADASMRWLARMYVPQDGLSISGWKTLSVIGRYEPCNPVDVARRTTMNPDKVTRAVDQLVKAKWVARTVDPEDRRRLTLRLTPSGRALHDRIDAVRREKETRFLAVLTPEERKAFYAIMDKLDAHGRAIFAEPPPSPARPPGRKR